MKAKVKSFKIYTLGCKVNQYDSGSLAARLKAYGFIMVKNKADLGIVNTCAVTQTALHKDRRMINKARSENPGAKIVVMGCWPKVYGNKILNQAGVTENKAMDYSGVTVIKNEKQFNEIISKFRKDQSSFIAGHGHGLISNDRSRYFIKIQDGCQQFCSYCVIPYARGKLQSRPIGEVMAEIHKAARSGFGEIVLCGIHLGLYGKDLNQRKPEKNISSDWNKTASGESVNLVKLLKKIIKIKSLGRVRLSSIEITEVSDELIELMAAGTRKRDDKKMTIGGRDKVTALAKICPHLHIPLQSGSDKILKLMNRPYDVKYFREKVKKIRRAMPDIALTTDVICGFPGETEAEFRKTRNFIKETRFSRLHVFPFSAHGRTPASKLPGRINEITKRERAESLKALGKKSAREYEKKFKGRELEVAVSQASTKTRLAGLSENYINVRFEKNQIISAGQEKFAKITQKNLVGRLLKIRLV